MIASESVAVVLLAAGLSRRFGADDKLATPLDGQPLGGHAARTLGGLPFAARIVVTRDGGPDFGVYGFTPVRHPDPGAGQSGSIRLGVAQARRARPEAILIALADMPRVPVDHIAALLARFDAAHPIIASVAEGRPSPPALFAAALFDTLETLTGDQGARLLLRAATLVAAPAAALADVDTPGDLATL
jgi:molybdenum cofactor cytidylyltransferase